MRIVVELNSNSTMETKFIAYCVDLNKVTRLSVNNSGLILSKNKDSFIKVHVGSNGAYSSSEKGLFFNSGDASSYGILYSVVMKLDQGKFLDRNTTYTSIKFENNCGINNKCVLDSDQPCVNGKFCGSTVSVDGTINDISLYIGFDGTDKNLAPLRSAGMLPHRLQAYSWRSHFSSVMEVLKPSNNTNNQ
ncbi:hypothetical protein AKO1_008171 [Acrasis kona]|uniref:Uncharacterized protein n=1 Tax=Acrasis kona TaxID=1008807 RepID=A0AAW2YNU8_9EUKA